MTEPRNRRDQANAYRSQVGWSCLQWILVGVGAVLGFVVGGYLNGGALASNPLLGLLVGFVIAPLIGAGLGWWISIELWASR